ncbi:MAG: GNAT family N-acetyltransferase [Candidatus Competibacteraceae bacterium]|jgi:ribosomal protein S18 acetylase RimI-like enzyme|nr:GNAT family N-acetyltransferase [Candidatus Competibacteraceae bacterium]
MLHIFSTVNPVNRTGQVATDNSLIYQAQTPSDFNHIRRLLESYAASFKVDLFALDGLAEELRGLPTCYSSPGFLLLAKQQQTTVGCIGLREKASGVGEMKRLFVIPEHQGAGIGRALVEQLLEHAQQRCFHTIQLEVLSSGKPALSLYRKLGFREIPRYRNRPVSELVAMELTLD